MRCGTSSINKVETVIAVPCPQCQRVLQIPEQFAGQTGRCNHCNTPIQVPTQEIGGFIPDPPKSSHPTTYAYAVAVILGAALCAFLFMLFQRAPQQNTPTAQSPTVQRSTTPPTATLPIRPPATTPIPTTQGLQANPQPAQDTTVYITPSGTKYHRQGCRTIKNSSQPIPLSQAQASYTPCKVCKP